MSLATIPPLAFAPLPKHPLVDMTDGSSDCSASLVYNWWCPTESQDITDKYIEFRNFLDLRKRQMYVGQKSKAN